MGRSRGLKVFGAVAVLVCGMGATAFAQELYYDVGPRQRNADDLARPFEADGLAISREAPLVSSGELGIRSALVAPPGPPSFEIEGPPIAPALPVLPVYPDLR